MRKEELLFKKSEAVKNIQWYVKNVLTDEDLKAFSIPQLKKMIELMDRAENFRESCEPFCTLSAIEVVQKSTGKLRFLKIPEKFAKKPPKSIWTVGANGTAARECTERL